jgi:hypothetical protein
LIQTFTRFIRSTLTSRNVARKSVSPRDLQKLKASLAACIADCEGTPALRLKHKIDHAQSVQDLWLLRNDAYLLIAQTISQAVAAERINSLLAGFEGRLERGQLTRIK